MRYQNSECEKKQCHPRLVFVKPARGSTKANESLRHPRLDRGPRADELGSRFRGNDILRFFIFLFLISTPLVRAEEGPTQFTEVASYEELIDAIQVVRAASRMRTEKAVDKEVVREAWETGMLINKHILNYKVRATYGNEVLKRLAGDLDTSETELRYMVQFARTYPIHHTSDELSWSHHKALLSINDDNKRKELAERAVKEKLSVRDLKAEVQKQVDSGANEEAGPLVAYPGEPYTYRIVRATSGPYNGLLVFDLGFSNYFRPEKFDKKWVEGDIITFQEKKPQINVDGAKMLYTYNANVLDVIDGDTFTAVVDLGFGFMTVQKLRLRALDAPELESSAGREAKEYMVMVLQGAALQIRTHKSDKYDRYLADVFVHGQYLNQDLVERGYAIAVEG